MNSTPDARAKRELREVFRAYKACGQTVRHHHECDRMYHVEDGSHEESSTDKDGNTTTRTVTDYSDIQIHLTFEVLAVIDHHRR